MVVMVLRRRGCRNVTAVLRMVLFKPDLRNVRAWQQENHLFIFEIQSSLIYGFAYDAWEIAADVALKIISATSGGGPPAGER